MPLPPSSSPNLRLSRLCPLALYLAFPSSLSGLEIPLPDSAAVHMEARAVETPPTIDGRLDDPVWEQAIACERFLQREPVEGAPASERTQVRILYDDERLYLAFRCFDSEPDRIIANRMRRDDELDENDHVLVIFDTYDDRRGGFFFSTNPLGAMWDMLLTDEGRTRNEAWNCVWQCRALRDEQGWTAEMAIPFDQLRYAESADAVWGINVGRTIRRKNEEVYLMPPPQSYGFMGQFRTSRLGALHGLGALSRRPRLELVPYVQAGSLRDRESLDPTQQSTLDTGADLKYGLSSGLTLDLSYRTDFAQVEADQAEVNLTRFSLFFPEKRGFFLEGAGIFEFGERRRAFGGPPPNLLFYSRRIGLQEGHNIPVLLGSKLTGRAGSYEIGVLNMSTAKETFIDPVTEDRFVTSTGEWLKEDDPLLGDAVLVDTIEVDVIDTLRVQRANFSVLRLRRDLLGRSSIGLIATNRDPGEESAYNRSLGADLNLSLLQAALNLRGFGAKTWSPEVRGEDYAGQLALEYRSGALETSASYLDIGENFDPQIGFVPRADIRKYSGSLRLRPRPQTPWIRQYSFGPFFTYLTDRNQVLQTRELELSFFVNLEVGDWIGVGFQNRFERLDESFEIHEDIDIPTGTYSFSFFSFDWFSSSARRLTAHGSVQMGDFYGGTRRHYSAEMAFKVNHRLSLESAGEINQIDLPQGQFLASSLSNRFAYSFSPDLFVRGLVQWSSADEKAGGNFLLNYRYRPGSDLYLVYNQTWDTQKDFDSLARSLQLKTTYFWNQ